MRPPSRCCAWCRWAVPSGSIPLGRRRKSKNRNWKQLLQNGGREARQTHERLGCRGRPVAWLGRRRSFHDRKSVLLKQLVGQMLERASFSAEGIIAPYMDVHSSQRCEAQWSTQSCRLPASGVAWLACARTPRYNCNTEASLCIHHARVVCWRSRTVCGARAWQGLGATPTINIVTITPSSKL